MDSKREAAANPGESEASSHPPGVHAPSERDDRAEQQEHAHIEDRNPSTDTQTPSSVDDEPGAAAAIPEESEASSHPPGVHALSERDERAEQQELTHIEDESSRPADTQTPSSVDGEPGAAAAIPEESNASSHPPDVHVLSERDDRAEQQEPEPLINSPSASSSSD